MAITRINQFQASVGNEDNMKAFLQSLVPYISGSPGCISCEVLSNDDNPSECIVLERWESKDAHRASVANFPQKDMQAAGILFSASPKGWYYSSVTD